MNTSSPAHHTAHANEPMGARWIWGLAAIGCVAFGIMAIEFTLAVRADRPGWWGMIQAALTSNEYSFGRGSAHQMYPVYRRALQAMTSHTMLGGLALGLGMLQFVPASRRRYPTVHRALGGMVILAVAISMVGALSYLAHTPLQAVYASPGFGLSLWALALVALAYLALAILAIRRRDFRSHMGFMALLMSTLLTAPVLRIEWALFGMALPFDMAAINQGVVSFLALTTTLLMVLWMHHVGAADLPARPREAFIPPLITTVLAWLTILIVAHEALLAPVGIDFLATWRESQARLPMIAVFWGIPTILLAWRAPREIAAAIAGTRATGMSQLLALASAGGALAIAWQQSLYSVDAVGLAFFWVAYGLVIATLVAATSASRRVDEPWTLLWLFLTLTASQWPLLWFIALASGQNFTVAMWLACTIGTAIMVANGFLTAFAIRLPFGASISQSSRR